MITADLHNHTLYSHAKDSVADMAASAYAKGIQVYGFSEHSMRPEGYAYPSDYQPRLQAGFPSYIAEVLDMRARYEGRMEVLLGLELDFMPEEIAYATAMAAEHPYDYIIGGLHFLGHWGFDWSAADWENLSPQTLHEHFTRYYHDLAVMASTGLFQTAAHPDLIKLFAKDAFAVWIKTPEALACVRDALGAIKERGMAMEVSSAAIRKGLGEPYPCTAVMGIARDLDLPIVFGSDAHNVADVASHFEDLASYAASFGYTESAVFRNRVMSMRPFS